MIQDQLTTTEQHLSQIADMLLLNGTLTGCPGLVHGKMGIAIFFFHYSQYTNDMLFADYAMDLIGEMQNQIHVSSPADYEKGIAGIGVGIDYLIRNKFLITEDDICEDFDQRMVRAVMYDPWQDFGMYDGLAGYGRYWISRLRYPAPAEHARKCLMHITERIEEKLPDIPAEEQTDVYGFLHDLQRISGFDHCLGILEQYRKKWDLSSADISRCFPRLGDSTTGRILRMYQRNRYFNDTLQDEIDVALQQIPAIDMDKAPAGTGLLSGYAGDGMLRLMALNQSNRSWMYIL
jgi:hypothetical protein